MRSSSAFSVAHMRESPENDPSYTLLPKESARSAGTDGSPQVVSQRSKMLHSATDVTLERKRTQMLSPLRPTCKFLVVWNLIMVSVILGDTFFQPYQCVALRLASPDDKRVLDCLDFSIWTLYLADSLLRLVTQRPSLDDFGMMLTKFPDIARAYVADGFTRDLVTLIPWVFIVRSFNIEFEAFSSESTVPLSEGILLLGFGSLRMTRILRTLCLPRLLDQWHHENHVSYAIWTTAAMAFQIGIALHVISCVWGLVGLCHIHGTSAWVLEYWPDAFTKNLRSGEVYCASLYWALVTTTSIGYGDIVPSSTNSLERFVAMVAIAVASVTWSFVVATAVELIRFIRSGFEEHQKTMDICDHVSRKHRIPKPLAGRVRHYFFKLHEVQMHRGTHSVISKMSPMLQSEFVRRMYAPWIQNVGWIGGMSSPCLVRLTLMMQSMLYTPREILGENRMLGFVQGGLMFVGGHLIVKGSCWGADCVMAGSMRKPMHGYALNFCEVLGLSHTQIEHVLKDFPTDAWMVRKTVCWLAVRRMICHLAEKARKLPESRVQMSELLDEETKVAPIDHVDVGDDSRYVVKIVRDEFAKAHHEMKEACRAAAAANNAGLHALGDRLDKFEDRISGVEDGMTRALAILSRLEARVEESSAKSRGRASLRSM